MISQLRISLILLILLPFLVQCQGQQATVSPLTPPDSPLTSPLDPTATDPALEAPQPPSSGMATAFGQAINAATGEPLPHVAVRLAEVYRGGENGAFVLDEALSPATLTDSDGRFVLDNVEPKEYVLVVGDVNVSYGIIAERSGDAKVWDLPADELVDMGVLEVTLN